MKSVVGKPRRVTDAQVEVIRKWHAALRGWEEKRRQVPTLAALARALRLQEITVLLIVLRGPEYRDLLNRRVGRPPAKVSPATRKMIIAWYARYRALELAREQMKPVREIAAEIGVPVKTVWSVTRRIAYKQASPEKRVEAMVERRRRLNRLRGLHLYHD